MTESRTAPAASGSTTRRGSSWEAVARRAAGRFGSAHEDEAAAELLRELLVFRLDGTAYAIAVERVREIVRMKPLTRIPRAPRWLIGVVALRGEVVEVVDLRQRLGLAASTLGRSHRIIILHGESDRVTGLLVDSVSEVHRIHAAEVMPSHGLDVSCVVEICSRGEEFISILDIERVLGVNDA